MFFTEDDLNKITKISLKELCQFQRGEIIRKDELSPGNYPLVAGGATSSYSCDRFNRDYECLSVAGSGAYAGTVNYWRVPFFCADAFTIRVVDPSKFLTKYLYYFLKMYQKEIYKKQKGGAIPHVYKSDLEVFDIYLPPLHVQKEIVHFLDNLSGLRENLADGLPAEIQAREKQYQYYLNRFCCPDFSKQ